MLVQIYEIQEPHQAEPLLMLGVEHIGSVVLDRERWRDPAVREVVRLTAGTASRSSLIPLFSDVDTVLRVLDYYRPDIVHFCENIPLRREAAGRSGGLVEKLVHLQQVIKERCPEIKITRSLPVPESHTVPEPEPSESSASAAEPEAVLRPCPAAEGLWRPTDSGAVPDGDRRNCATPKQRKRPEEAKAAMRDGIAALVGIFAPVSDFFMTDTLLGEPGGAGGDAAQPVAGFVGITGATCDWELAAWLVRISPRPVILAGGLGPENVAAAIARVHPAGVDSCTRTNAVDLQGRPIRFRKDFNKVQRFVAAARRADAAS